MGAAGLPFVLGPTRAQPRHHARASATPSRRCGTIYVDTILHDPRVLRFVIDMIGSDRIMMGSDMPFPIGDTEPLKIVQAAGLSPAEAASINGGLARELFRL